jgi:FkbM family methyltransferase
MLQIIARPIRKILNSFGYEIIKKTDAFTGSKSGNWLEKLNIATIIDIGANEGQFIKAISQTIPGRKIIAFEPIKACYDKLLTNTSHLSVTAYNCGLSNESGTAEINISENFVSSSILPIEQLTTTLYPDSKYVNKQTIELRRLDDVMKDHKLAPNVLLKIDVQGYEEQVLAGSLDTLSKVSAVIIEFSYQPLYAGQWLFEETYDFFTAQGFSFAGLADQANSKETGIPIYGDAIFIRKEPLQRIFGK